MEWYGRHVNATADGTQRRHCVQRGPSDTGIWRSGIVQRCQKSDGLGGARLGFDSRKGLSCSLLDLDWLWGTPSGVLGIFSARHNVTESEGFQTRLQQVSGCRNTTLYNLTH